MDIVVGASQQGGQPHSRSECRVQQSVLMRATAHYKTEKHPKRPPFIPHKIF